ncbi:MAG: HD domain-containing protein [Candidatus Omnitrophica bacterium]|nr:HD domain-containing protein [Candidatus Omnitrophota bacterium]
MTRKISKVARQYVADKKIVLWGLFFEKLLRNLEACVVVTDDRGKIIFTNKKFSDFFNYTEDDVRNTDWIDTVIPEPKQKAVDKVFTKIRQKRLLARFDAPVMTASGINRFLCWTCIPVKEKDDIFYMFIGLEPKDHTRYDVRTYVVGTADKVRTYKKIVDLLFNASMVSEPDTAVHAARVMLFAVMLAKRLKLSKARIEKLKSAALLHDLGKLLVDEKILYKKGRLSEKEFDQIRMHPSWGSNAVRFVYFLQDIIPIMICHHENYDGSGYPKGIKGNAIPLEARILSIADVFEALTADRPYRKGFSPEEAIKIMTMEKGIKFDPKLVDIFFHMIKGGRILKEYF